MSSVQRQHQLLSGRPGMFIRDSLPRFTKSCSGAITQPLVRLEVGLQVREVPVVVPVCQQRVV